MRYTGLIARHSEQQLKQSVNQYKPFRFKHYGREYQHYSIIGMQQIVKLLVQLQVVQEQQAVV